MTKKDLLYFLDDFLEGEEVRFWSNGRAIPVTKVIDDKIRKCILLK